MSSSSLRHLNALRAFEAAARHQSIAKAADELNVSHSVVSQHIRNLEEWLGVSLFDRGSNRISLSEDGQQFVPHITHGLQILRDACENMLQLNRAGTLNISAEPAIASRWLRQKIAAFAEAYPRVECNLTADWQVPSFEDGHFDVVVHFQERLAMSKSPKSRLFPIDAFPSCSPALHARIIGSGETALFAGEPLIHDHGRHIWQLWFAEHEPRNEAWKQGKPYSNLPLAIDAAVDGEGVFLADRIICARELANGALIALDNRKTRCTWYEIATNEASESKPLAETFRHWILNHVWETCCDAGLSLDEDLGAALRQA